MCVCICVHVKRYYLNSSNQTKVYIYIVKEKGKVMKSRLMGLKWKDQMTNRIKVRYVEEWLKYDKIFLLILFITYDQKTNVRRRDI